MYDELVKRLRRYSENVVAYKLDADFASAIQEAADAIEDLSKRVPKSPHGRLIDADAFVDELGQFCDDNWVYNTLRHAPTIIPTEEGET